MTLLCEDDRQFVDRFIERALELHAVGAVTTESAVEYISRIVAAIDSQAGDAVQHMRAILEDAWRDADA